MVYLYAIHERIGASRTDTKGVIKLASALDIIQDCSLLWMESEPSFLAYLARNNLGMFLVSRQADIRRLPVYGETVTAQTSVFECRSYCGYRNTFLYGEDRLPCVLTWSIGAFVDMDTGKMAKLPTEEIDKITYDDKINMDYLDKKISLPDIPGRRLDAIPVKRSDIDFYHHMNNARYIEAALELLPDDARIKRVRIEYKMPAKPGELMYPQVIQTPNGKRYVLLLDSKDKPYTIIEFTC